MFLETGIDELVEVEGAEPKWLRTPEESYTTSPLAPAALAAATATAARVRFGGCDCARALPLAYALGLALGEGVLDQMPPFCLECSTSALSCEKAHDLPLVQQLLT